MPYYAHIRQDENGETIYQTVAEHLTGTAALCREFAADFGAEADGDLMGLAHDLGKCTDAFQKRLLEGGPVVDHTTAGMLTCIRMKRPSAAACVAGHHGGLLDVGNLRTDRAGEATLSGRFKKGVEGCDVTRSVSKMTEIERRGGKRWDKPKKAEKSRDCGGGKF